MKKYLYFIIAAAAVLSACAKEENSAEPEKPLDPATALFSGTIIQPNGLDGTKVSIDEEHSDASNTAIRWDENDEIVVEAQNGDADPKSYSFFADRDDGTVYFGCDESLVPEVSSWLTDNDASGYTAYYPAYIYNTELQELSLPTTLDCDSEQYGNQASLVKMPLQAQTGAIQTPGHENRKLEFSSPYAILQFAVPSTLDADKMEVYLNDDSEYFVSVANFDNLEADEYGNIVFYAPIPPTNVLWGYAEGYDKLTFVAKKAGQEEAVATMSTFVGTDKIYVDANAIYSFDFLNTLEISEAGTYNLVQNGLDYRINITTDVDNVTINANAETGTKPANISINARGYKVDNLEVYAPESHVVVENGEAVAAKSITGATTFVAKSTFHINTLTVEKGSVVVEGTEGVKNVDKIVISSEATEPISINLEGVTTGNKVVIENQSSIEPEIAGEYEEEKPATKPYIKVVESLTDWSGEYLLVYENEGKAYIWTGVDVVNCYAEATITDDAITSLPTGAATLTIEEVDGGYSIKINGGTNDGKYIGQNKYDNGMSISETALVNTLEIAEGAAKISGAGVSGDTHVTIRYNSNSDQKRFRYYKSGQKPVQLYKLEESPLSSIEISGEPTKTSYSVGEKFDTDGLTVTATYEDASTKDVTDNVTWTVDPETLTAGTTSVSIVANYGGKKSGEFVVNGLSVKELSSISIKTAPTKVTYNEGDNFDPTGLVIYRHYSDETNDEYAYAGHEDEFTFDPALDTPLATSNTGVTITYSGKSVTQTITVNEKPALETMDAIFAAATKAGSTATEVKVKFGDWVVSGVKNKNAYLTDNNGKGLIIYTSNHGFEVDDVLSGTAACKVQLYNGSAELTDLTSTTTGLTVTKGGSITPATIAIADLSGVNTGAVITFDKLQYTGEGLFSDGTNTIKPYNTFMDLPSLTSGRNYKVTGVYIQYNQIKEIAPRSTDDFVLIEEPYLNAEADKTSVTAAGGTVTITVDTNVEDWSVKSDNTEFVVGDKDGETVPVVVSENTSTAEGRTAHITVSATGVDDVVITLTQAKKDIPHDDEVFFYESFNQCDGTGGNDGSWSGGIASSTLTADNVDWTFVKQGGASKCAKFGTGSAQGSAETPEINVSTSTAVLKFKAAAWGTSDATTLKLSISSGTATLAKSSVTMKNSEWDTFKVDLTGVSGKIKIKFEGNSSSNSRFFLDEVYVYYGAEPEMPKDNPIITSTDKTITLSGDPASASQDLKEMFSSNSTGEFTYSLESSSATASISGYTFTATAKGTYTVVANQAATDSYNAGSAEATITVNEASQGGGTPHTYTMTIDSSNNGNNNVHWTGSSVTSLTYDNVTWSTSVTGTTSFTSSTTYCQVGSQKNPATKVSLTTSAFAGKTITSVKVTCYCMSNTGPTLTVTAGSSKMINAVALTKTTSTEMSSSAGITATLGASEILSIEFNSSAKAAICISKIEVSYTD